MICLLVVLYRKTVADSATLKRLLVQQAHLGHYLLWVWDNGPLTLPDEDQQLLARHFSDFTYTHQPANSPLAALYNEVIAQCAANRRCEYLVLLDHDTLLPENYLNQLEKAAESSPALILPVLVQKGRVRSPQRFTFRGYRPVNNSPAQPISSAGLMAINSGMAISMHWLKKSGFRYPEQLKNYGTDNALMLAFAKSRQRVTLLPEPIEHSLSFFEGGAVERKVVVFREIRRANRLLDYPWWQRILIELHTFASSLKYCLMYKTTAFLHG